ncbi:MAG: DNA-binding CsgD family transcriptional regulator [Saprospiraceae bacterium]|jgi:DNA-binding CsgD family transcriptional regulator
MMVSTREKEVLSLIAYEFTSNEIAQKLFMSIHKAISHRQNLMAKFGVRNTAGLIRRGFELGYIQLCNTTSGLSLSSYTN